MTELAIPRLDAAPQAPAGRAPGSRTYRRSCCECGQSFVAKARHGEFCQASCRKAWNNRRMTRGAELYDLFMALRFERQVATDLKLWQLLNRMAAGFRERDDAERAGRQSWRPPQEVIAERPYLRATAKGRI